MKRKTYDTAVRNLDGFQRNNIWKNARIRQGNAHHRYTCTKNASRYYSVVRSSACLIIVFCFFILSTLVYPCTSQRSVLIIIVPSVQSVFFFFLHEQDVSDKRGQMMSGHANRARFSLLFNLYVLNTRVCGRRVFIGESSIKSIIPVYRG